MIKNFTIFGILVSCSLVIAGPQFDPKTGAVSEKATVGEASADRLVVDLDVEARYDSNLDLREVDENEGFAFIFAPSLILSLIGDELSTVALDIHYDPTLYFDTDEGDWDTDQEVMAKLNFRGARLKAFAEGGYLYYSGGHVRSLSDTERTVFLREERRASSHRYLANAGASYEYSPLLTQTVKVGFVSVDYDGGLNDYTGFSVDTAFLYNATPKLSVGPYGAYERIEANNQPTQDAFQVGGRVNFRYSPLTVLFASVGGEYRTYEGAGNLGDDWNTVWGLGANWAPDELLNVSLRFSRYIRPSVSSDGENFATNQVSLAIRKDLFDSYFINTVGSYNHANYDATINSAVSTGREDDYWTAFIEVGRNFQFLSAAQASLYYMYLNNDSNADGLSFESHAVGIKVGVTF